MTEQEHGSVAMGDSSALQTVSTAELQEALRLLPIVMRNHLANRIISALNEQASIIASMKRTSLARRLSFEAALSRPAQEPVDGDLSLLPWPASGWAIDRVDELKTALEPFADVSDLIDVETEGFSDEDETNLMFADYLLKSYTIADFRKARSAISALYAAPQPTHGTSATERGIEARCATYEDILRVVCGHLELPQSESGPADDIHLYDRALEAMDEYTCKADADLAENTRLRFKAEAQVVQLRKALADMVPPKLTWKERDADGFLIHHQVGAINAARAALATSEGSGQGVEAALQRALDFIESLTADPLLLADDIEMSLSDVQSHARIELASIRKALSTPTPKEESK